MINRPIRVPNPRGINRKNWPPPAPNILICPDLPNLICCFLCNIGINSWRVREYTLKHNQAPWIACQLWVFPPGTVQPFVNGVKTIDLRWGCEVLCYNCPLFWNRLVEFRFPVSRDVQTVAPVCYLQMVSEIQNHQVSRTS